MPDITYKLSMKQITKSFPGVKALQDFSIDVKPGTVHAIIGENGAGKSTLMKVLSGYHRADSGQILIDGKEIQINNAQDADRYGIAMIFQEISYMPDFTVGEQLFNKREPQRIKGIVDWKELYRRADQLLKENALTYSSRTRMKDLSVADIQLLDIARVMSYGAKILIMDEPTSSISGVDVDRLLEKVRELKEQGVTILYISHKLDELFRISDEITVMRDGQHILTEETSKCTEDMIITAMVGRKIDDIYPAYEPMEGNTVLEVKNLKRRGTGKSVSFYTRKGEILGIAGLVGAGRSELMYALMGLLPKESGEISLEGTPLHIRSVDSAIDNGIFMATEDRKRYGLIAVRDIKENISLPNLRQMSRFGVISRRREQDADQKMFEYLNVKAAGMGVPVYTLSGGNQQKVVLAKWLLGKPKVLILDEPTKGIDVGAKHEIYKLMVELIRQGVSIIMISSEMSEIIGMCKRVYVMNNDEIVDEVSGDDVSQEKIMESIVRTSV